MISEQAIDIYDRYQNALHNWNAAPSVVSLQRLSEIGVSLLSEIDDGCVVETPEDQAVLDYMLRSVIVTAIML